MVTTGGGRAAVISVELWVLVTAVLLLAKFVVGSAGPRFFSTRRIIGPMVQILHMLNYYSVTYTLGLMKPSSDEKRRVGARVEDFFQVWAVLIVTMQDSVRIGRPYRPVEMTLVDLLSSLWAANQLRVHTEIQLKVPVWLIWSIHALRVIWFYVSSNRAADASVDSMKLVSDYMMASRRTSDVDGNACPYTMRGYRYIVAGEEEQNLMSVRPPGFALEMDLTTGPEKGEQLLTVEKVWQNAGNSGDSLLSTVADSDNRFKDVCLSFALYKLQRRRFYDFPIAEAAHPAAASRLVADAILEEGEDGCYERALRITEVELSFLHDSFYSKHAAVFSGGFPWVRLALSLLMTAAALYLAYAVRNIHIPSTGNAVTGRKQRTVTIAHGLPITLLVIAIVVSRELAEVGVYVMSQWSKVRIICRYIRLKEGSCWQRFITEKVARIMFLCVRRGRWNQHIRQYNLLMSVLRINTSVPWVPRIQQPQMLVILRKVKLPTEVKKAVFQSLKAVIRSAQVNHSPSSLKAEDESAVITQEEMNRRLSSYFTNAFAFAVVNDDERRHTSSPSSPPVIKEDTTCGLDGETHRILVWHIATSLCQIKAIQLLEKKKQARMDLYTLAPPKSSSRGKLVPAAMSESVWPHYMTAVSLSNYCAYLITQGLLPDNGLVSEMVFGAVRDEVRHELARCHTMAQLHEGSMRAAKNPIKSILGMGAELSESLMSEYVDMDHLWERLAKFWAGYLLHLSASTRAAKHQMHLQGRGEFTTHLWVLLSHAGFLGETHHGEQMLDPVDRNDA